MKLFKRNWIYKGIGETFTIFSTKKFVHIWQCTITNKVKTRDI